MHAPNPSVDPALRLERLQGYLAGDPDNAAMRADVFHLALQLASLEVAQAQTTWALHRAPDDRSWRHRQALLAMARGHWPEAESLLQGLIDEGEDSPAVACNLAYVHFAVERYAQAVSLLQPLAAQQLQQAPQSLALLLRCLHRQGAVDEALEVFARHADQDPSADAFGVASLLALDAGEMRRAWAWSARALERDPQQHEALVARGTTLLGRRDAEGAMACLNAALARHPLDGRTLSALAMARLLQSDFDAAHEAFVLAVKYMPLHIGTWLGLGWCEVFRRRMPAAQLAFENALDLDRNFGESHGGLAVVQALRGEAEEAQESIRRAHKLDPGGLSARYAQAVLSGDVADPAKFQAIVRDALGAHRDAEGRSLAELVLGRPRAAAAARAPGGRDLH
ncbi:tetratricopeptide repeat protein [Variovorax sp. RB2P76]|uniref:tetratricopeptide repeat protein n=1 Tax=Variovorax sp. RB2P76 TaxID=3443736 RepID=UPI003F4528F2